MRYIVLLFALLALVSSQNISIGNRLIRTYTEYITLPTTTTSASSSGWNTTGVCDPFIGIAYNYNRNAPYVDGPLTLYFTLAGQIAGIAIDVFGTVPSTLVDMGLWVPVKDNQYRITVTFRSTVELCSGAISPNPLGDRLIVNAGSIIPNLSIPTTTAEAEYLNWFKGSCFAGMGYHYFYDLSTAPKMSWNSAYLFPIVPMYNNGTINAIFFASTSVQQDIFSSHWWEPIPLVNLLMCKNTCDSNCTFAGTSFWSTFHVYFRDYTQVTCAGGCTISCCP